MTTDRDRFIDGLRDAADFFDQNPDFPLPYDTTHGGKGASLIVVENDPTVFAGLVSLLGGDRKKDGNDTIITVARDFGAAVRVEILALRDQVCERVKVGTEQVKVETVVRPAIVEHSTEERDVYEWKCAPILSAVLR